MELAHAGDDRLAGFLVGEDAECRVFLSEALESDAHLFLVDFGFRLDRHRDDGVGERWWLEEDRMVFVAERVAGGDILDAHDGGDVAGVAGVDVLALVGLDLDQAADALALVGARIVNRVALGELARVHAEEDELSNEGVAPELERQRAECPVVG